MTELTSNLNLPYLAAGQAQKHVTLNESLRRLDAMVQMTVESATTAAEPGSPVDGEVYIVPTGKSGTHWDGFTNWAIGYYRDGAWEQIIPRRGWRVWVRDTSVMLVYDGSTWTAAPWMPVAGGSWASDASFSVVASASGFPVTAYQRAGDAGRSLAMGFDGANRRIFVNRWDYTTDSYVENLLLIDQAGVVDFVGAAPPRVGGASVFHGGASAIPTADNARDLGSASFRFATVYAATGTINTSDAREKTDLREISAAESAAVLRVLADVGMFRWRDAICAKGEAGAREHCGVTAQAVAEAFAAEGLDAARYGLFCADPVFEAVEIEPERLEVVTMDGGRVGEVKIPAVYENRPVHDQATDEQYARLGLRYDQLFAMALAVLSRGLKHG